MKNTLLRPPRISRCGAAITLAALSAASAALTGCESAGQDALSGSAAGAAEGNGSVLTFRKVHGPDRDRIHFTTSFEADDRWTAEFRTDSGGGPVAAKYTFTRAT